MNAIAHVILNRAKEAVGLKSEAEKTAATAREALKAVLAAEQIAADEAAAAWADLEHVDVDPRSATPPRQISGSRPWNGPGHSASADYHGLAPVSRRPLDEQRSRILVELADFRTAVHLGEIPADQKREDRMVLEIARLGSLEEGLRRRARAAEDRASQARMNSSYARLTVTQAEQLVGARTRTSDDAEFEVDTHGLRRQGGPEEWAVDWKRMQTVAPIGGPDDPKVA